MTGAGAPGAPGIIHCIEQDPNIDLTVADADQNATGRYLAKQFIKIPRADDPQFSQQVLQICREKDINLIMPLVTKELFHFSKHKILFEENKVKVLVSCEASINIVNDKSGCYRTLQKKGIRVPKFYVVNTVEDFIHAAFELGHPVKPFCFKPSVSNGSRGVRIVSDSLNESLMLFNEKPYNLNISYAHAIQILSSKPFPQLLVSEYLPGGEYSVDCLVNHGKPIAIVPRSRLKMVNGISVQGEFLNHEGIIAYCRQIIESTSLHGNIGIQVKMSEQNEPLLLEINPRVQGTIVAALGAGINLPLLAIKQEMGQHINPSELEVKWGTRFSRFWTEVYY